MGLGIKHKERNMKCWHCQTDLIWGSDKKIEDDHVMGNDEFSTVTDLSCPACNAYVEVYLPKELEK